jgi:hypothetical protein
MRLASALGASAGSSVTSHQFHESLAHVHRSRPSAYMPFALEPGKRVA